MYPFGLGGAVDSGTLIVAALVASAVALAVPGLARGSLG